MKHLGRGEIRATMESATRVYVVPSPTPEKEGTVGLPLHRRLLRSVNSAHLLATVLFIYM